MYNSSYSKAFYLHIAIRSVTAQRCYFRSRKKANVATEREASSHVTVMMLTAGQQQQQFVCVNCSARQKSM